MKKVYIIRLMAYAKKADGSRRMVVSDTIGAFDSMKKARKFVENTWPESKLEYSSEDYHRYEVHTDDPDEWDAVYVISTHKLNKPG